MISISVLKMPLIEQDRINKGAIILSDVDKVVEKFPNILKYMYIIERRGWEGINDSKCADIKLVEDSSVWEETKKKFPNSILLDIAGADFVDTNNFRPLNLKKRYTGIQISTWQDFKRPELFFKGIKLLKDRKFLKFGHLIYSGKDENEIKYRDKFVSYSKKNKLNVEILYSDLQSNDGLPNDPKDINHLINKSKIGVLTSKVEGINRFKLECLSADIPVIVPKDANTSLKKHVNEMTGLLYEPTPEGLAKAIEKIEKNYKDFSPREYVLKNTGIQISLEKLINSLEFLAERDNTKKIYGDIYWDGRNQSLLWDEKAIEFISKLMQKLENETHFN